MGTQLYPVALEARSKKEILAKYCKPKKQTKKIHDWGSRKRFRRIYYSWEVKLLWPQTPS